MFLLFQNFSLVEVIYLMIRSHKNTERNDVNKQNTHATHREKDNFKKD